MLTQSNSHQSSTAHEAVISGTDSADSTTIVSGRPGSAAPSQRPADDSADGDLTDIDLGSPSDAAAMPEPDDPVPVSMPLPEIRPGPSLSDDALATPPLRSAGASSSSHADSPHKIVLGSGVRSITLTTYEDSVSMQAGSVTADGQALDAQVNSTSSTSHGVR